MKNDGSLLTKADSDPSRTVKWKAREGKSSPCVA